jgi:uncharacterized cupin superfamily protein
MAMLTRCKTIAGPEWREVAHFQYQVPGRLHFLMEDGAEFELRHGDVSVLPPGHDAWVVGDGPVARVDWSGATKYAKT